MIRGYSGGFKTNAARVLREESVTLTVFLANLGLHLPGASTLNEHANHVSNATRQFILDAQIRQILDEGWDDFNSLTIESTAGFELALELSVKATLTHRRLAEVPTTWRDRTSGKSNFKLRKWLPNYLHWYFVAFRGRFSRRRRAS